MPKEIALNLNLCGRKLASEKIHVLFGAQFSAADAYTLKNPNFDLIHNKMYNAVHSVVSSIENKCRGR